MRERCLIDFEKHPEVLKQREPERRHLKYRNADTCRYQYEVRVQEF